MSRRAHVRIMPSQPKSRYQAFWFFSYFSVTSNFSHNIFNIFEPGLFLLIMKRIETIKKLKKYFDIRELVSSKVYAFLGEHCWELFDTRLLETLLVLRENILKVPIVVNTWMSGGTLSQRGYRENICNIVAEKTKSNILYISAHTLGMAVDFSSPKMTAEEMRKLINENAIKLPHQIRLEDGKKAPTWVHIDVRTDDSKIKKITIF